MGPEGGRGHLSLRTIIGTVAGGKRFMGGALKIEHFDVVGSGMEPWARRVQGKFRTDRPETPEGFSVEKGLSFGERAGIEKRIRQSSGGWRLNRETIEARAI